MEFAKYGTLEDLKLVTVNEMAVAFQQVSSAISYLHNNGCVHRDIKPANILVMSKLPIQTKISDFELISDEQLKTRCGTGLFMAPEIFHSVAVRLYDKAVDIWALGITILGFCLFASFPPRPDGMPDDTAAEWARALPQSNRTVRPGWERLAQAAKVMLVIDPRDRPSADQSTMLMANCFSTAIPTEGLDDNLRFLQTQRDVKLPIMLTWIKVDYSRALFAAISLDRLECVSYLTHRKAMHQLRISNVDSYIDTSGEIYTRLDFARAILKPEAKESLEFIEDLLQTAHLATFRDPVNREPINGSTSTSC